MRARTILRWIIALTVGVATVFAVLRWDALIPARRTLRATVEATTLHDATIELFVGDTTGFTAAKSERHPVTGSNIRQRVHFTRLLDSAHFTRLRIDPGDVRGDLLLHRILLEGPGGTVELHGRDLIDRVIELKNAAIVPSVERTALVRSIGEDPQIVLSLEPNDDLLPIIHAPPRMMRWVLALLAGVLGFILLFGLLPHLPLQHVRGDRSTALLLLMDVLVFISVFGVVSRMRQEHTGIHMRFQVLVPHSDQWHLFYSDDPKHFDGGRSIEYAIEGSKAPQWTSFALPLDSFPRFLRLDPGSKGDTVMVLSAALVKGDDILDIPLADLFPTIENVHEVDSILPTSAGLLIRPRGRDPYFTITLDMRDRARALSNEGLPLLQPLVAAFLLTLLVHAGVRRSELIRAMNAADPSDLIMAGGFVLLIVVPVVTLFNPGIEPRGSFSEKRALAEIPELELASIGSFTGAFDAWYREHFGMRSELFRWNSLVHWAALKTSSLPDKVIVGKNGWLFQYNEHLDGNYRGIPKYTFDELERIRLKYEERQALLARFGIDYYLLVPPLSGNINRQHMPDRLRRASSATWLDQMRDHFHRYSTVPLIDPTASLLEAGKEAPIYFTTDIHWNPYGAYFGYRDLIERIHEDRPEVGPPWPLTDLHFVENTNENADLANMLGLNDILTRVEPVCIPKRARSAEYFYRPSNLPGSAYFRSEPKTFISPDTTKLDLLMFHDSFGLYMMPLLAEHFHRSTFVWSGLFVPDVVPAEKPDIVVQEFMEMFIENMPKDDVPRSW